MITQELFDKLPQLDRIEFRQVEDIIKERFKPELTFVVLKFYLFFFIVGSLFIGLCFGGEVMLSYMYDFKENLGWVALAFVIAVAVDLFLLSLKSKKLKELVDKYFEIETKLRERKNGKRKK